jgi:predicted nucleic acid-binding protein
VYDALYVALAEALGAPLLTRDAKLARSAGRLVEVIHVG